MKVEVGSSKKKLLRSTWAGYMEKMGDEKLAKRADGQTVDENGGEEDRNCVRKFD